MARTKLPYEVQEFAVKLRLHPPIHGEIINAINKLVEQGNSKAGSIVKLLVSGGASATEVVETEIQVNEEEMFSMISSGFFS